MNVLSIDFDIIMAPDIALYNAMINTSPEGSIEQRIKEFPMLAGCRADLNHYQKLVNLILNVTEGISVEDIRVAFSHEDIKTVLTDLEDVHMYNIDHHHDLGYPQEDDSTPSDACSCANWCDYHFNKNIIVQYTWYNNTNSGPVPPDWIESDKVFIKDFQELNIASLPKMDKVFLCLSPEWTPSMYHPLFFTILDLINKQKDCILPVH
jgi:hypothetical protein